MVAIERPSGSAKVALCLPSCYIVWQSGSRIIAFGASPVLIPLFRPLVHEVRALNDEYMCALKDLDFRHLDESDWGALLWETRDVPELQRAEAFLKALETILEN